MSVIITGPGLYRMSHEEYLADPCAVPSLNNSIAKILNARTPAHAWEAHPKLNPRYEEKQSTQFDIGRAAHSIFLEGINKIQVCDFNDWRKKEAQEQRDAAYAAGKIPLLPDQNNTVLQMIAKAQEALTNCEELGEIAQKGLGCGESEVVGIWEDLEGVVCRMKMDWLKDDSSFILDYKTTDIFNPEAWIRSIPANGYDMQENFYTRGMYAIAGKTPDFAFMVQETSPPFEVYFVGLPPGYREIGKMKVDSAILTWAQCRKSDIWPGYTSRIMYADPPAWLKADFEVMQDNRDHSDALKRFDKDAPGAKENFLAGKVRD